MKLNDYTIRWVRSEADIGEMARSLVAAPVIAMDTEFMRTITFHPRPALVQLATPGHVWLVDCVSIKDLSAISEIMAAQAPVKLFHSVGEDLVVLERLGLPHVKPVFDTQIAAAWLGYPLQHAFQKLVADELGIELDKAATRTDWLQRPLSDEQIRYAIEDVTWLLALYEKLRPRLDDETASRIPAMVQETLDRQKEAGQPDRYYLKLRGGFRLSRSRQARLQALAAWREQCCQAEDATRNRVVSDKDLLAIVEHLPKTRDELARVTTLRGAGLRKRAPDILRILKDPDIPDEPSHGLIAQPLPRELKPRLAVMREVAERLSAVQGWPQSLVYDRKTLEALVGGRLTPENSGWRQPFIEQLLKEVEEHECP